MSPFWTPKHDFLGPLWHKCFIVFLSDLKSRKVFVFQYFSMVWDHQKPLIFLSFLNSVFMFFQNRYPGLFLEGPSAELFEKIVFGCHFRLSWFSKRHLLGTTFAQQAAQNLVPRSTGSILFATLLFTKPR